MPQLSQEHIINMRDDEQWITVILNLYKRPYVIEEQIKAIEAQTLQPREIILINNGCFFETPQWIKDKYLVIENNHNFGVWFRFTVALNAKTKYICMIDDDSIPWTMRLENCITESKKQRWLYGTIWLLYGIYWDRDMYYSHSRIWRANPNEQSAQVDILWHNWFFERDWLCVYFSEPLDPQYRMCWEDMSLSYYFQKIWINTYVAPHPKEKPEMRWSLKGWDLWSIDSSFANHWRGEWDVYDQYHKILRAKWFKFMID